MMFGIMHLVHVLAAFLWVGYAFILVMNSSTLATYVGDNDRPSAWAALLGSLNIWLWGAIIATWVSGGWLMFYYFGGFGQAGAHVDTMFLLAFIMTLMTIAEFIVTRPKFNKAVAGGDGELAAAKLKAILRHGKIILVLGILTTAVASYGPF
jgi:uncharacterized membrane protein